MARIIELAKMRECHSWGYQGENGATILVADISEFLSSDQDGKASVIFQRQDGHPYIHNFTIIGENLFIELNSTDTQLQGKCEVQIGWAKGNRIYKKTTYQSFILPSALEEDLPLTEDSLVALDNLQTYVEEAKKLLSEAEQYAAEIIFVEELPADGIFGKLYIEKNTNTAYIWGGEKFVSIGGEAELLYGGNAFYPND